MKKVLFGVLSVVSLAGLVACGSAANSIDEVSENPTGEPSLDAGSEPTMTDEMPGDTEMPVDATDKTPVEGTEVSDSDLEISIQENLATLYPDTPFEVTSEAGAVTIAGDVPSQEEADYIAEWVSEIEGVTEVEVVPSEAEATL